MTKRWMRRTVALAVLVTCLTTGVRPAQATEEYVTDFGVGLGTVLADLVYMPTKVVFATLGGITGCLAWVLTFGNTETAKAIWVPSMGGTYVLTPPMLRGEEPIHFSGGLDDDHGRRDSGDADEPRDARVPREGY